MLIYVVNKPRKCPWASSIFAIKQLCPTRPLSYLIGRGRTAGYSQPKVAVVSPPFLSHPGSFYFYSLSEVLGSLKWKQSVATSNWYKGWRYRGWIPCEDEFINHCLRCPRQLSKVSCAPVFVVTGCVWTVWVQPVLGCGYKNAASKDFLAIF